MASTTLAFGKARAIAAKKPKEEGDGPSPRHSQLPPSCAVSPDPYPHGGGQTIDIRNPEMVRVGRGVLIIFSYVSDDPDIFDRWDTVSLMLIENLTHVEAPAA
jgi:hypothetical protein